ncbi:putative F-box protein [Dioszegia hungarica]|uniref:F-box protein n=1 Tax=Dioszegia hungarica TaxID=4972 RepID=A0AA38H9V0_9TREE|nr:putative F-box protein [Dioszegia hungarica]KAI9636998.1 putative F-box protein [Dioszegia hungarica]
MIPADDEPLDIMPTRAGRKLCVRHKQMANQDVNQKLQRSLDNLPTTERGHITHLWSTFSNAPHAKRKLILEGILTMCCFSQLSHLSDSLNLLIRIDPFSLLPREINLRVLGYLDAISLGRAAQVSQSWKALADDDLLWRRMCGQHIDRKCEKCGWGLPLLERRRLRGELNEGSPSVAVGVGVHEHHHHDDGSGTRAGSKEGKMKHNGEASSSGGLSVPTPALKRVKISTLSDSETEIAEGADGRPARDKGKARAAEENSSAGSLSREVRMTRPWKSVYCERLVVERNWRKGRCKMTTLKGHEDGIMCLQYHTSLATPSHPVLITGSYDKTVRIWNLDTGDCLRVLRGHTRAVRALQFDQRLLFTGAMDGTVRIWNWRAGECLRVLEGHSDGVVSLSYNGYLLASGSKDSTINIWNFRSGAKFTLRGHEEWVNSVMLWDGKNNPGDVDPAQMPSFAGLSKRNASLSTSSTTTPAPPSIEPGTMLFSCSDDQTIKLWDLTSRECIRTFSGHKAGVQTLRVLMVDMTEAEIAARKRLRSATPPSHGPGSGGWGPASQAPMIPAGGVAVQGRFVDVPEGFDPHLHRAIRGKGVEPKVFVHGAPPTDAEGMDVDESEAGTDAEEGGRQKRAVLMSGSLDGTIKVWDVATGQEEKTLFGHIEGVWGVDVDALRIASASHDRTVKVWDRESGNCVQTLVGHRGSVTSLQLSDDMIVSGSDDGDVMVWSFAPGAEEAGREKGLAKKVQL